MSIVHVVVLKSIILMKKKGAKSSVHPLSLEGAEIFFFFNVKALGIYDSLAFWISDYQK